jgi:HAD superfamily hydrolase (TIGR01509 family)
MRERALIVDLLIFDCDGVLVDSEPLAARAYADVLAEIGVAISPEIWPQCIGRKQADIFAILEQAAGRPFGQAPRERLWPRTRELFAAELKPTPGLVPFLEASAIRRCVASSSSPERIAFSLEATGLAPYFPDIFSTQYVARGKPAPDIFLHAAQRMGADPARAVVIEDAPPGVEGARAAGAQVIGYVGGAHADDRHGERLKSAGAHLIAKDWTEIADYLVTGEVRGV